MPHLISDAYEWINDIPIVPIYYLAKPQPEPQFENISLFNTYQNPLRSEWVRPYNLRGNLY